MRTTGIGSLPHRDASEAADFVIASASVPYLPQLPARHAEEGMLLQWGDGLCGCGGSDGTLRAGGMIGDRSEAFGGAHALLDRLPDATPTVKLQATGPVTLAAAMHAGGHSPEGLWGCVAAGLLDRVARLVSVVGSKLPHAEMLLVYDEPALTALGEGPPVSGKTRALEVLGRVLAASPVPAGIHCCGDTDWEAVAALGPAAVSLDVASVAISSPETAEALARAVSAGTRMIWGAVPTDVFPVPAAERLAARVRRAEGALVMAGADLERLSGAWVSPVCGLAGTTPEQAGVVAQRLVEVAEVLGD